MGKKGKRGKKSKRVALRAEEEEEEVEEEVEVDAEVARLAEGVEDLSLVLKIKAGSLEVEEAQEPSPVSAELEAALRTGDVEHVYRVASKEYGPEVLAMLTSEPYHGGPLFGFVVRPRGPGTTPMLLNAFKTEYDNLDTGEKAVEYLNLEKLANLRAAAFHPMLPKLLKWVREQQRTGRPGSSAPEIPVGVPVLQGRSVGGEAVSVGRRTLES